MNDGVWSDHLMSALMTALDVAVIDCSERDAPRVMGRPPDWFVGFFPEGRRREVLPLTERMLFLESFLADAASCWKEGDCHLKSGQWSEANPRGDVCHLEATAISVEGRDLLLIELLGIEWERTQRIMQSAREGKLDAYRRHLRQQQITETLRSDKGELQRIVDERTRELRSVNQDLLQQIAQARALEERAATLREQLDRAARAGTLGEVASQLAHELNQPLAAILNYGKGSLRVLERGDDPGALVGPLEKIVAQAARAGGIVERLREYVVKGEVRRVPTDVNALVREVADLLMVDVTRGRVDLRLNLAADLPLVRVDAIRIQQVLVNLVRNAVEALAEVPEEDRIIFLGTEFETESGEVVAYCRDSGPGMPESDLDKVFEPYWSTKKDGMGMGLAISRSIAETHGGSMSVSRNDLGGLTLRLRLPTERKEEA